MSSSDTVLLAVDFQGAITDGFRSVATFVPKLVGFLVILLVGYFIAKTVAKIVDKVLERVHFDEAVEKGPVKQALSRSQYDASDIVSKLVFYAIFIPALSMAIGTLGIAALQRPLEQFIALIPQIIVAVVLVVIGGVVAGAVKKLIEGALGGLSYGAVLGNVVGALIMLSFVKAALDQVGIATTVTTPVLITILATVGGILVVGVGGALITPMQGRLETMLSKAESEGRNAKAQVSSSTSPYPSDSASATTAAYPTTGSSTRL
jgi:flagellar biosynthesis protein FlhB